MNESLVVEYLVAQNKTPAGNRNNFLSAISWLAEEEGIDETRPDFSYDDYEVKLDECVRALITSLTACLGPEEMLRQHNQEQPPSWFTPDQSPIFQPSLVLSVAVTLGNYRDVRFLLNNRVEPVDVNKESEAGFPLTAAIKTGSMDITLLLLQRGAKVDHGDGDKWLIPDSTRLPLHAAAAKGDVPMLRLIQKKKHHCISSGPRYEKAACLAVAGGHDDAMWFLIKECTHFPDMGHFKGLLMLEAAKAGRLGMVKMMLDQGVDVDFTAQTGGNDTALSWAGKRRQTEVVRFLVRLIRDQRAGRM
jgi:hypothetical protein